MTTWDPRANDLFLKALELRSPGERREFLDGACAGDAALRAEVESLLEASAQAGSFLASPAAGLPSPLGGEGQGVRGVATVDEPPVSKRPGTVIGPYKLVEQIGEGGMGTVWMAQQTEPVKRLVAVKLIKAGMDSQQVIARFEAERQALALMDHPNIAKVLDAGATGAGRPYFVMDLVKGVPITRYCDEHRLTPRQRLELFIPICQAVQHAHQKGIIHRDLKPSNVLVALYDGKPAPKVIDFGVAKAAGQTLTDKTLVTGFGAVVGTLEYMSPEQAELNQLDIDTRSDIYSLGVLLYELLTGSPPITRKDLEAAGLLETLRAIREQEPTKPSTKLSTAEGLPTLAANRGTEPAKLMRLVKGELDWIVMKALEKDRNRRYETANALAQDIRRHLSDEPVDACPPSAWYRFSKFARRRRAGLLTAAAAFVVVLLAASGVGWVLWDRAAQDASQRQDWAGRLAETDQTVSVALARAAQWAGQAEGLQTATSQEASAALGVWGQADGALAEAEAALRTGAAEEPLRQRIADVRRRLADGRRQTEQRRAQALRQETLLRDLERARLRWTTMVGDAFDYAGAAADYRAAFAAYGLEVKPGATADMALRIRAEEPAVRDALLVALDEWALAADWPRGGSSGPELRALAVAADDDVWRKRYRAATAAQDRTTLRDLSVEVRKSSLPPSSLNLLATSLEEAGEHDEALVLLRWARRQHPTNFFLHYDLGVFLTKDQDRTAPVDLEEGIGCYLAALALRPDATEVRINLGLALVYKKQLDDAITEYRKAIDVDPESAVAHNGLGATLYDRKQLDEAITEYRKAIVLDPKNASAHVNLGTGLLDKQQLDEAVAECREAVRLNKDYAEAHCTLGNALRAKGHQDEAIAEYREAIRLKKDYFEAHYNLGHALHANKQLNEAITEYREAVRLNKDYVGAHSDLGAALYEMKRLDDAIAEFRRAVDLDPKNDIPHSNLGNALVDKQQLDEAIAECREAVRLNKDSPPAHNNLGRALTAKGQLDEAIAEYREVIRLQKGVPQAHYNLGYALQANGQLVEAIAAYREAIRLKKDYPQAHCNLGLALQQQGEFRQALEELRRGDELGSKDPSWSLPSAQWVRQCERLVDLDSQLPGFLERSVVPTSPAERIELAGLCSLKRLNRAAARFYEDAFSVEPKLADDLGAAHRYNAACAAALAGCGQGKDADKLDGEERAGLRRQALGWLRADLEAWGRLLDKEPGKAQLVGTVLRHWPEDADLAGVRGPGALAKLPEAERQPWQKLWGDLADALARAQAKTTPEKKSDAK